MKSKKNSVPGPGHYKNVYPKDQGTSFSFKRSEIIGSRLVHSQMDFKMRDSSRHKKFRTRRKRHNSYKNSPVESNSDSDFSDDDQLIFYKDLQTGKTVLNEKNLKSQQKKVTLKIK